MMIKKSRKTKIPNDESKGKKNHKIYLLIPRNNYITA